MRRLSFNSLFEILIFHNGNTRRGEKLSILFLRFMTNTGYADFIISAFNSLFEIPYRLHAAAHNFPPKVYHFQFSFWDSREDVLHEVWFAGWLSILFLRFLPKLISIYQSSDVRNAFNSLFEIPGHVRHRGHDHVVEAFNSLFEIHIYMGVVVVWGRGVLLSILFLRFHRSGGFDSVDFAESFNSLFEILKNIMVRLNESEYRMLFQFSFWDSEDPVSYTHLTLPTILRV